MFRIRGINMMDKEKGIDDMDMILDIQRVAYSLNTNTLSLEEYLLNGGIYEEETINDCESGGFANKCELAGIKVGKRN